MGLQIVRVPDVVDGRLARALTLGHFAATPVRLADGLAPQCGVHNRGDLVETESGFAAPTGSDLPQPIQPLFQKPISPQSNRLAVDRHLFADGYIGLAAGAEGYNPAAQGHLLRCPMGSDPTFNLDLIGRRKGNNRRQDTVWRRSNRMPSYLMGTTLATA